LLFHINSDRNLIFQSSHIENHFFYPLFQKRISEYLCAYEKSSKISKFISKLIKTTEIQY